jgi:flagellar hook-basal body complex protein FliE
MKVEALIPDVPAASPAVPGDPDAFARALDAVGSLLGGAEDAEDSFAAKRGSLQAAVYERARADVALSVATAAAQRAAQAISSILNMQV